MMIFSRLRSEIAAAIVVLMVGPSLAAAQTAAAGGAASRLTVERIFASGEFASRGVGQLRWLDDSTCVALQAAQPAGGAELARFSARTGARTVMVPATWLTPNGAQAPLEVENYTWSPDKKRLLV